MMGQVKVTAYWGAYLGVANAVDGRGHLLTIGGGVAGQRRTIAILSRMMERRKIIGKKEDRE